MCVSKELRTLPEQFARVSPWLALDLGTVSHILWHNFHIFVGLFSHIVGLFSHIVALSMFLSNWMVSPPPSLGYVRDAGAMFAKRANGFVVVANNFFLKS